MTDCPNGLMRDLLPQYALGVLGEEDAARVAAHVAECDACRAELVLLARARTSFALAAPRMDVAAIVSALPSAPRAGRVAAPAWMRRHVWQYATAAGLLLAVGGGIVWQTAPETTPAPLADTTLARGIAAPESTALAAPDSDEGITFGGGLSDLSLDDLQKLMGQMDSVRTLPSKDPESVTIVIANEGGRTL
jgi:anti-sigma factor RsiW